MREILFRGKRIDNGEWVYGLPYKAKYGDISSIVDADEERTLVIPDTVGQYTGLMDKNGNKIFEGDIVKIYWQENTATIGFIIYVNCLCRFTIVEHGVPYGFDDTTPLEVIGNIHDNPELLEVDQ